MAGNDTSARIRAENSYKAAMNSGTTSQKDIAILKASYDAARTKELQATGKNEQARSLL